MEEIETFDTEFQKAVSAMDAGNVETLEHMLTLHPNLIQERLESPGKWLTDKIENALKGFFQKPYLLWFIAEDPIRNNRLPPNAVHIAALIIEKAKQFRVNNLQEQIDYALRLVAWSVVAPKCNVQIALLDILIDAGASTEGVPLDALVNRNFEAAKHLIDRGARLTLATAVCLKYWDDAHRLAPMASAEEKQLSLTLAALTGQAEALAFLVKQEIDLDKPSADLYSHAPAIHHAVSSGSLESVKVLIEAGASPNIKDTVYGGTPLGWADFGNHHEIAQYLRRHGGQ